MADASLKVVIGADVSQGVAGINQFNAAVAKIKPGALQAQQAMFNFGRVVQDAPFGLIGVANNIDPLIRSFQQLKTSTGSAGLAFKALAGSLMGPAGIALAVSAATSLLITFGDRLFKSSDSADTAKEATKRLKEETEKYQQQIESVVKSQADEANKVGLLVEKLKSGTLERRETVAAINQLKQIAPDYFSKLDSEKSKIEDIVQAYGLYNKSLLKSIENRIKLAELEKLTTERLQTEQRLLAAGINVDQLKELVTTFKDFQFGGGGIRTGAAGQKFVELFRKELELIRDISEDIDLQDLGINAKGGGDKIEKQVEDLARLRYASILSKEELAKLQAVQDAVFGPRKEKQTAFDGTAPTIPPLQIIGDEEAAKQKKHLMDMEEMALRLSDVVGNTLAPAFDAVFQTIFEGGKNALQAFGQAIVAVIKRLAAAAVTAAIFAAIISAATGTSFNLNFKNIGSQLGIPKFAEGGIVNKPTLGLFGEAGPEAVIPLNKMNDLIGSGGGELSGTLTADGDKLVALVTRITKKNSFTY